MSGTRWPSTGAILHSRNHNDAQNASLQACTPVSCTCMGFQVVKPKKNSKKNRKTSKIQRLVKKSETLRQTSHQNTAPMLSKFRLESPKFHANGSLVRQEVTECACRRPGALGLIAGNKLGPTFLPKRAPPTETARNF